MLLFDAYDVIWGRGFNRPPGYLSWWVIPVFDWIGLPLFAWAVVRFVKLTNPRHDSLAIAPFWTFVEVLIAVIVTFVFIKTAVGADWTKSEGAGFASLNFFGWYHTAIFALAAWLLFAFLLRGGIYLHEVGGAEAAKSFWQAVFIFLLSFGGVQILDVPIRLGYRLSPNDLLGFLLGGLVNF